MLPPTTESFYKNAMRAHLQACIWRQTLDSDLPQLDPTKFEWIRNETTQTLAATTVPNGVELAPATILKMITCSRPLFLS